MMLKLLLFLATIFVGAFAFTPRSEAACDPLALCSCTASATGVSFGSYTLTNSTPDDAVGSVTVLCTLTVSLAGSYSIALSPGGSGSFATRTLTSGTSSLSYNLYTSMARTQIWGDGTSSTGTVIGSFPALLLNSQTFSIYGRIPAGQNAPAGGYADSIVVTVTY